MQDRLPVSPRALFFLNAKKNRGRKNAQGLRPLRIPGVKNYRFALPSAPTSWDVTRRDLRRPALCVKGADTGDHRTSAERSGERGNECAARSAKDVPTTLRPILPTHRGVSQEGRLLSPSWVIFLSIFFLSAKRIWPPEGSAMRNSEKCPQQTI